MLHLGFILALGALPHTHSARIGAADCSCNQCSAVLHRQHNFHLGNGTEQNAKLVVQPSHVKCQADGGKESNGCTDFCSSKCAPKPGFSQLVQKAAQSPQAGFSCEPIVAQKAEASMEPAPLNLVQLRALRALTKVCPVPQKCDCWCVCKEIDYGAPMPPGIPPLAPALDPYAPPPPVPKPPPQPFGAGPPPAVGVPFNPQSVVFQQESSQPQSSIVLNQSPLLLQRRESRSRVEQPAANYKANAGYTCPEAAPCNCYCGCRPSVPSKASVFR